ncbi:hypothetical protein G3O00_16085 [Burkholderia sp. Ac-20384]|uniref:HrpB1 family type III secretion system apparatus protein n=1 Tax=Burkholderia sp. Ac-20384 TaxID=2703902 RepID=UPI0019823B09|nr:HrpB1 family type III secretion system apparatus protein [Burkholderia sp. Ac-20384]MBN3825127.1 hypothetical protein [Burkholderia sp. Ac-20384]
MDVTESRSPCPAAVVGSLVDLTGAAFAHHGIYAGVDIDDIDHLVSMLHLLRPGNVEFSFFDGWLLMLRDEWSEAEALFRSQVRQSVCLPASQGMLMKCLAVRTEFGWQDEVREILAGVGDKSVHRLGKLLLAGDELKRAAASVRRGGRFVPPESILELEEHGGEQMGEAANATTAGAFQPSSTYDMLMAMQYLRI